VNGCQLLHRDIAIVAGRRYRLALQMRRESAPATIRVALYHDGAVDGDWNEDAPTLRCVVGTSWTLCSSEITATRDDVRARLGIMVGGAPGVTWVDAITLSGC